MFGYNTYNEQSVSYIFNLNHLWLVLAVGGFIAILLLLLKGKTEKRRKITMFIILLIRRIRTKRTGLVVEYFLPDVCHYDVVYNNNATIKRVC